jgi:hypothetical protein
MARRDPVGSISERASQLNRERASTDELESQHQRIRGDEEMGLLSKDPVKEQAKADAKAEKAAAEAEVRFWASPKGQARKAHQDERRWVEIIAPVSESRIGGGDLTGFKSTDITMRTTHQTPLIEDVEFEGWQLEHAGWVFQQPETTSRDKQGFPGQVETIGGKIVGIYLFKRLDQQSAGQG